MIEALVEAGADLTVFFYNPNIHPLAEYEKRKAEVVRYTTKKGVPFIDADYDAEAWFHRVKGLENEPERGNRCSVCFSVRLEGTALYAHENGFPLFATSLGISRWKDLEQVNKAGNAAAARYNNVRFWDFNWRKQGGIEKQAEVASREDFYRQDYCGCAYSLKARNERLKNQEASTIS